MKKIDPNIPKPEKLSRVAERWRRDAMRTKGSKRRTHELRLTKKSAELLERLLNSLRSGGFEMIKCERNGARVRVTIQRVKTY